MAGGSHGVVIRTELLRAAVTVAEIKHRLATGALLREHRGVYRVGHRAPSVEAQYLAAVRACGEGSLLWGATAGHLLALLRNAPPVPEVLTPSERRIKGVITHRSRHIDPRDATVWRGIPVTTVPRTLVDLAAVLSVDDLARACHEAEVRYRTTPHDVEKVLERRPKSPGARKLREILYGDHRVTLSKLEAAFLQRLRAAGLVLPRPTAPPAGAAWTAAGRRTG